MRIKDVPMVLGNTLPASAPEEKKVSTGFAQEFSRRRHDTETAEYQEYLKELQRKIGEQGERVSDKADIAEFYKYRALISELLNEAVSNAYAFSKTSQFDARGRHKVFALIRRVNGKLDELAAEILKNESEHLRLLNLVEDIRGLLVDLYY